MSQSQPIQAVSEKALPKPLDKEFTRLQNLVLVTSLLLLPQIYVTSFAQVTQTPDPRFPVADGWVYTSAERDGILYIGGNLSKIGPQTGAFASVDRGTGKFVPPSPAINGVVKCAVMSDDKTVYFGGSFTAGQPPYNQNLLSLSANQSINSGFQFSSDGKVNALAALGSTLYVGGEFSNVNGVASRGISAIDRHTGQPISFSISTDGTVTALAIYNNTLFVGGTFTRIGDQNRTRLASINLETGLVTDWDPSPNSAFDLGISKLQVDGASLYVSGDFFEIGGKSRTTIAKFSLPGGTLADWNPLPAAEWTSFGVYTFTVGPDAVYLGGNFTSLGGEPRSNAGAVDKTLGNPLPWAPQFRLGPVLSMAFDGADVFLGGEFLQVDDLNLARLAKVDSVSGMIRKWSANPGGSVLTVLPVTDHVFIGGAFDSIGGSTRTLAGAIDLADGSVQEWDPHLGAEAASGDYVSAVTAANDSIYLGGRFYSVGGYRQSGTARVRPITGERFPFESAIYGFFQGLTPAGTNLVAYGSVGSPQGGPGDTFVLQSETGVDADWQFRTDAPIRSVASLGNWVYLGGAFQSINNRALSWLTAFDVTTREPAPWTPTLDGEVSRILVHNQTVIAVGGFRTANGVPCAGIAVFDAVNGQLLAGPTNWLADDVVRTLAADERAVYLGGDFAVVNGEKRSGIAALDLFTGELLPWDPFANTSGQKPAVFTALSTSSNLVVGGSFSTAGGMPRANLAIFPSPPRTWSLRLISPTNETTLVAGDEVGVDLDVGLQSSEILSAQVLSGNSPIAEWSKPPYNASWIAPKKVGNYLLTVVVRLKEGGSIVLHSSRVNVKPPEGYKPISVVVTTPAPSATYKMGPLQVETHLNHPTSQLTQLKTYIDSLLVSTSLEGIDSFKYVIESLPPGSHTIYQSISDEFGYEAASEVVQFTINEPPKIALLSPIDRAVVPSNEPLTLEASATDSTDPVQSVKFLDDASVIAELTSPPYRMVVTNLALGRHLIRAVATDAFGESTESSPALVKVFPGPSESLLIDNDDPGAEFTGQWLTQSELPGFWGNDYRTTRSVVAEPQATATYTPVISKSGFYDLYARLPDRTEAVTGVWTIHHADGVTEASIPGIKGSAEWFRLASGLRMEAGTGNFARFSNVTGWDNNQLVIADALRFDSSTRPYFVDPVVGGRTNVGWGFELIAFMRGTLPMTFQWRHDGIDIPGAVQPVLRILPVQTNDAGRYSVVVSNIVGTITSEDVEFIVDPPPPPKLVGLTLFPDGRLRFVVQGVRAGRGAPAFAIEVSSDAKNWSASTNWTPVSPFQVTLPPSPDTARFVRLKWPPN